MNRPSEEAIEQARILARGNRHRLRWRAGQQGLSGKRINHCGRNAVDWYVPVLMKDGVASYAGIITCGSVSACPVCSAKIRQEKALEVEWRAKAWLQAGHGLLFVTLTLPHSRDDDLGDLVDGELDAWRGMQQDHQLRRALKAAGYVGPLRALEVTHGGWHGWHPHVHLLLWFERPLSEPESLALQGKIYEAWADQVGRRMDRTPSREHGVKVDVVGALRDGEAVARYLVKMQDGYEQPSSTSTRWSAAHEMTRGDLKKGRKTSRSPFQILEAAVDGDAGSARLWRRYERSLKGRRVLQWGQKLYGRLKAEQDPPEETAAPVLALELTRPDWNALRSYSQQLRLLVAIERHGPAGGVAVMRSVHRRVRHDLRRYGTSRDPATAAAAVVGQLVDQGQQVG